MHPDFDPQPTLTGNTMTLRPMRPDDLDPLHAVAKDPLIWSGHPAKDRHERQVFEPYFDMLLTSGTSLIATVAGTDTIIGCSRYYAAPDHAHSLSIGYTFLTRDQWGGTANFEMKRLMLDHAFACVDAVWLHIDPQNIRSQKATAKLGASLAYEADIGLGGKAGLWQCWRIDAQAWATVKAAQNA